MTRSWLDKRVVYFLIICVKRLFDLQLSILKNLYMHILLSIDVVLNAFRCMKILSLYNKLTYMLWINSWILYFFVYYFIPRTTPLLKPNLTHWHITVERTKHTALVFIYTLVTLRSWKYSTCHQPGSLTRSSPSFKLFIVHLVFLTLQIWAYLDYRIRKGTFEYMISIIASFIT